MCKGNACGCGGGGSSGLVIAAAVAVLAAADAAAGIIGDVITVAAVTTAVVVAAAVAGLVYVLRRESATALYAPERPAALPATRSHALGARSPAAISTGRRPIPATAITIHEEGVQR